MKMIIVIMILNDDGDKNQDESYYDDDYDGGSYDDDGSSYDDDDDEEEEEDYILSNIRNLHIYNIYPIHILLYLHNIHLCINHIHILSISSLYHASLYH